MNVKLLNQINLLLKALQTLPFVRGREKDRQLLKKIPTELIKKAKKEKGLCNH